MNKESLPPFQGQAPFKYDIVGSFLRTQAVKNARAEFEKGNLSADSLRKIEDKEIAVLVEKQKQIGLRAITDGEFRRGWWHLDFLWELDGINKTGGPWLYCLSWQGYQSRND